MDVHFYIGRIEAAVENPDELDRIQSEARDDSDLSDADKQLIEARAATFLADQDREEYGDEHDPENAPEEVA